MAIRVRIGGNRLPDIARVLPAAAGVIVKRNGESAALTAQQDAPYDTGELHDSIDFQMTGQTSGEIIVGAEHGKFVEYGTRYQHAQPFLRPAIEQQRPKFEADFQRLGDMLK